VAVNYGGLTKKFQKNFKKLCWNKKLLYLCNPFGNDGRGNQNKTKLRVPMWVLYNKVISHCEVWWFKKFIDTVFK
jgi:hypothetical protein